jgi:hypothetical protein
MRTDTLGAQLGTSVAVDICLPCQVIWFDAHESLQLAPASVLTLFQMIGERSSPPQPAGVARPPCPRCDIRLLPTHDMQRTTKFEYLRCPRGHGRLITFVNFLREKNFIQPLTPQQIDELRRNVRIVNCSSCGAPIDLAHASACAHCGSPLSMIDVEQAGALVHALQEASRPRTVDPALPLELERARRQVDAAFASFEHDRGWFDDVASGGLVAASLRAFTRWLTYGGQGKPDAN